MSLLVSMGKTHRDNRPERNHPVTLCVTGPRKILRLPFDSLRSLGVAEDVGVNKSFG